MGWVGLGEEGIPVLLLIHFFISLFIFQSLGLRFPVITLPSSNEPLPVNDVQDIFNMGVKARPVIGQLGGRPRALGAIDCRLKIHFSLITLQRKHLHEAVPGQGLVATEITAGELKLRLLSFFYCPGISCPS